VNLTHGFVTSAHHRCLLGRRVVVLGLSHVQPHVPLSFTPLSSAHSCGSCRCHIHCISPVLTLHCCTCPYPPFPPLPSSRMLVTGNPTTGYDVGTITSAALLAMTYPRAQATGEMAATVMATLGGEGVGGRGAGGVQGCSAWGRGKGGRGGGAGTGNVQVCCPGNKCGCEALGIGSHDPSTTSRRWLELCPYLGTSDVPVVCAASPLHTKPDKGGQAHAAWMYAMPQSVAC
jgi:hypothetical protein